MQGVDQVLCVVNPTAGMRRGAEINGRLAAELPGAEIRYTRHQGHGADLARSAVDEGYRTIVAVGGDGTLSEVANGILAADGTEKVRLGFVPAGTCNDFARARPVAGHLRELLDPARDRQVEVGVVRYRDRRGEVVTSYFLVSCTIGLISVIGERFTEKTPINQALKRVSLSLAEAVSSIRVLAGWRAIPMRLTSGCQERLGPLTNVAVLKVPYFAGGLTFGAPVEPGFGFLDAVLVGDLGRGGVLALMWKVFRGRAADHPAVRHWPVEEISVESPKTVPLEVDGEIVGFGPASFSVLPARLTTVT